MRNSAGGLGWPDGWVSTALPGLAGYRRRGAALAARETIGTRASVADGPTAVGLGWPGQGVAAADLAAAGLAAAGLADADGDGAGRAEADRRPGPGVADDAGRADPAAFPDDEIDQGDSGGVRVPSDRVGRVLARVPRETLGTGPVRGEGAAGARPPRSGWRDGAIAQGREGEVPVAVPVTRSATGDTPIARAAEAAVVARSGGEAWPRPSSCRVITIANQKGGVGKTTTAVNLAAGLAMHGCRVLVVDLDPQGNASTALDVEHRSGVASVYDVLVDDRPLAAVVQPVAGFAQLYCAPAAIDLAGAEIELVPQVARESRLARALVNYDASNLDYIFIDCPPSLGLLTVNALVAAPEVLIPIQCEYYALEGLEQLLRTIELVRSHLNPELSVTTILLTMYDGRTRLASQVADEVRDHFGSIVLGSIIPRSVRVSEAPSYGQSVMTYDPGSSGAVAYMEAARELAARSVQLSG